MNLYGPRELADSMRTVRKNTIRIAEDIPEDKYDFVAVPGTRSVSELLRHIAFAPTLYDDMHRVRRVTTLKGYDFGVALGAAAASEKAHRSKAEIVALLTTEGHRDVIEMREGLKDDRYNLRMPPPVPLVPLTSVVRLK